MNVINNLHPISPVGGGLPAGGTEHAGHAAWATLITPFANLKDFGGPPKTSEYGDPMKRKIVLAPSVTWKSAGDGRKQLILVTLPNGLLGLKPASEAIDGVGDSGMEIQQGPLRPSPPGPPSLLSPSSSDYMMETRSTPSVAEQVLGIRPSEEMSDISPPSKRFRDFSLPTGEEIMKDEYFITPGTSVKSAGTSVKSAGTSVKSIGETSDKASINIPIPPPPKPEDIPIPPPQNIPDLVSNNPNVKPGLAPEHRMPRGLGFAESLKAQKGKLITPPEPVEPAKGAVSAESLKAQKGKLTTPPDPVKQGLGGNEFAESLKAQKGKLTTVERTTRYERPKPAESANVTLEDVLKQSLYRRRLGTAGSTASGSRGSRGSFSDLPESPHDPTPTIPAQASEVPVQKDNSIQNYNFLSGSTGFFNEEIERPVRKIIRGQGKYFAQSPQVSENESKEKKRFSNRKKEKVDYSKMQNSSESSGSEYLSRKRK